MSFTTHGSRAARYRTAVVALAVVGVLTIAGCGGGSNPTPAAGTLTPTTAASAPPAAASTGTGTGTGTCGEATAALVAAHLTMPGIVSVTTEGGCHDATIVTSLGPTDAVKGLAICDSAAEVAYAAGDISSITVTAADNTELAIGIKGQPCIGEP